MRQFRAWNDTVRLLSGDWALEPGRKPIFWAKRYAHEVETRIRETVQHPILLSLTLVLLIVILIF